MNHDNEPVYIIILQASPGTPDMIPPQMGGNYGPMMPMDDPRVFPNNMAYSPNSMQDVGMYPMGPMGPNTGRSGPMPGNQSPYQFPGPQGPPGHGPMGPVPHVNHRMPQPGQGPGPMGNGKTYPSSASMVFNSSNPNAPPIYPCGICHKEVHDNDHAILCESGCNFWYHRACTGLTEPAFVMLTQEVYAEWACDGCLQTRNIPLVKMKS